jgi:MFS family permease
MNIALYWLLVVVICICGFCGAYISAVLVLFSASLIDYAPMQRQTIDTKAVWIALFGIISFCGSILIIMLSSRIAGLLFRIFRLRLSNLF